MCRPFSFAVILSKPIPNVINVKLNHRMSVLKICYKFPSCCVSCRTARPPWSCIFVLHPQWKCRKQKNKPQSFSTHSQEGNFCLCCKKVYIYIYIFLNSVKLSLKNNNNKRIFSVQINRSNKFVLITLARERTKIHWGLEELGTGNVYLFVFSFSGGSDVVKREESSIHFAYHTTLSPV